MRDGLARARGSRRPESALLGAPRSGTILSCVPLLEWGSRNEESMCRLPQSLVLMATILAWTEPRTAASALLIVPDQYPTIHSAVTAASSGDSILIRAGTYVDSLSWSGKDLTLLGESGAAEITTNGTGRVLDLGAGVTLATVLEGLVISHGLADAGGGLRLRDGAGAVIRHCRFEGNRAYGYLVAYGGGLLAGS